MPESTNFQISEFDHEIRDDEQVCEVTGYVYYTGLSKSPHIDSEGVPTW